FEASSSDENRFISFYGRRWSSNLDIRTLPGSDRNLVEQHAHHNSGTECPGEWPKSRYTDDGRNSGHRRRIASNRPEFPQLESSRTFQHSHWRCRRSMDIGTLSRTNDASIEWNSS